MTDLILPRRQFLVGLAAAIAAPAVIRFAPLMPISVRHMPIYIPVNWIGWSDGAQWNDLAELKRHGWPKPLGPNWINLNDFDPSFARSWAKQLEPGDELEDGFLPVVFEPKVIERGEDGWWS